MKGYQRMIIEMTGCSQQDAPEIEEIMREDIFHSTLDWQTRAQFRKAALEAQEMLPDIRNIKATIAHSAPAGKGAA